MAMMVMALFNANPLEHAGGVGGNDNPGSAAPPTSGNEADAPLVVPPYPPLAPPFPQTWQLNRSTIIHTSTATLPSF